VLDLAELIRGVSYARGEASPTAATGRVALIRANNIADGLVLNDLQYVPVGRVSDEQHLRVGDVVIAMSSGSKSVVGKAASVRKSWDGAFGAFCGVLRPTAMLNHGYFGLYFQTRDYRSAISEAAAGTNINNLKREHFADQRLPLPPLAEQKRIVAKVEESLGRVNAARERLAKVPALLKRFRQSVLAAACSGQLTEDWREGQEAAGEANSLKQTLLGRRKKAGWRTGRSDIATAESAAGCVGEVPQSWSTIRIDDLLAKPLCNGTPPPGTEAPPGVASLKLNAMTDRGFDYNLVRYIKIADDVAEDLAIREGDFFVSRGNGSLSLVGRGSLAQRPPRRTVYPDTMIRVRLAPEVAGTRWVPAIWPSRTIRDQIEAKAKTTAGIWRISQTDLASVIVPLPPLTEQHEIVRRVEALFALADKIEAHVQAATARVEKITQALLAKAFRGELVPTEAELARQEGRDYEPASVLLERIRASRSEDGSQPNQGRTRRRRKA
jgi:type I restriction enzyme S subunit